MHTTAAVRPISPAPRSQPLLDETPAVERWLARLGICLAVCLAIYLVGVAWTLTVDYFDSYDILLNARCIATGSSRDWRSWRSLGLPVMLSQWFAAERALGWPHFAFRASHLTALAFWAGLILLCNRLFRLDLSRRSALAATLLLTFNPLLVHCAPMAKEDVPAAALVVACFYAYLRASRTQNMRGFLIAGLFGGIAMATRQNLPPLVLGTLVLAELVRAFGRRDSLRAYLMKSFALVVLPLAIFILTPLLVFPTIGMSSLTDAPRVQLRDMRGHLKIIATDWRDEGIVKNFRFVVEAMTIPVASLAMVGLIAALAGRRRGALFHAIWFAVFFGFHTSFIKHREARYLFAAFPPLYFFAGVAVETIAERASRTAPRWRRPALAGALLLLFCFPLFATLGECRRFLDPAYHDGFAEQVCRQLTQTAGENPMGWLGPYYPLHPRQFVFDAEDESTSLYHLGHPAVAFYTERAAVDLHTIRNCTGEVDELALNFPNLAASVPDGSALVVNRENSDYTTKTIPASLKPLAIRRLRNWEFSRKDDGSFPPVSSSTHLGAITIKSSGNALAVSGAGFDCQKCAVLLTREGTDQPSMSAWNIVDVAEGHFEAVVGDAKGISPHRVTVLFFDTRVEFSE